MSAWKTGGCPGGTGSRHMLMAMQMLYMMHVSREESRLPPGTWLTLSPTLRGVSMFMELGVEGLPEAAEAP